MFLLSNTIIPTNDNLEPFSKAVLIILIISFLIIGFFFFFFLTRRNKKVIKKASSSKSFERQVKLNIKDSTYSYLNKKKPNNMITKPLSEFYSQFNIQDQDEIRNWIVSLIDPSSKQNETKEKYVLEKRKKEYIFASFKHIKSNYLDQTIYFNVSIFPLIKKQNILKANHSSLTSVIDMSKYLDSQKKSKKKNMSILAIHLYNKSNFLFKNYDEEVHIHLLNILNNFQSINKNSLYAMYDNSTLNIITFKYKSEKKIKCDLDNMMSIIYNYLSLNNITNIFDYSIGIYYNKDYEDDLLISKAKKAHQSAIYSKKSSSKIKYTYYSKDIFENESYSESVIKEATSILRSNSFFTNYKPFVQLNSGTNNITKTKGFIYSISPKSDIINSIEEFERIVSNCDESYNYIKASINNFLTAFQNPSIKKNSIKNVIMRIEPLFISNILSYFKYNKIEDIAITFLIDENFFLNSEYDILQIKNDFNKIKQLGYSIGINIQNHQSPIQSEVLSLFDLFVLEEEILEKYRKNTRISILTKALIKNLLRYKTPILAKGIKNWTDAELLYSYGISYFSGDAISKENENIQEVDKNLSNKMQHVAR